jgi:NitT/TauT family transport system permease protein
MNEFGKTVVSSILAGLGLLLIWWLATGWGGVPKTVMPSPGDYLDAMRRGFVEGQLLPHVVFTGQASLLGLVIGVALGIAAGSCVALIRPLGPFITPLVIAMQSVPKVAVAPLLVAYLGFGMGSKVFTSALLCFFPLFVGAMTGLREADRQLIDLFRGFRASRLHILRHVLIPAAAPYLFAALQISIALSLIGCVVSEFVASSRGLGYVIKARAAELDVAMMFAALTALALMGVAATMILRFLQRRIVFWQAT